MDAWVLWLIAAVILAVGEIATMSFFLAPFAGGAAAAALISALGGGTLLEMGGFVAVSVVLLAALRPLAHSHKRMPPQIRTGTAALVGKTAIVTERIHNDTGSGCVKLDGEVWTARTYEDEGTIETGQRVRVVEIRGATALVTEE